MNRYKVLVPNTEAGVMSDNTVLWCVFMACATVVIIVGIVYGKDTLG